MKAEGKAEDSYSFNSLADEICERLGDKEWAKKVYKKAEEKVEEDFDFLRIAESICEQLGDKTWVKRYTSK